ncbi:hypothetical protein R50072_26380 [Simiduia litorea]
MIMKIKTLMLLCVLVFFLIGCPRLAYVDIYNNSWVKIEVNSSGYKHEIRPGESVRLKLTGQNFVVESELGRWFYPRNIPCFAGDCEYFDGVLRVQINQDSRAYLLKTDEVFPIVEFVEQPEGYPLVGVADQ